MLRAIHDFNSRREINGIVLQLPLPVPLNTKFNYFLNEIDPEKDIDCLNESNYNNMSHFKANSNISFPCVVMAIDLMLEQYKVICQDKIAVILSKSYLVGCPVRSLFHMKGSTVIMCDEFSKNVHSILSQADILILGTGKQITLENEYIKEGCVVFDIGIRIKDENGILKVSGDLDNEKV